MSTLEAVLSRAMNDAEFAEALFTNAEKALAEYDLTAEEKDQLKSMSRTDFDAFSSASPEERKSFGWSNHNQSALKVAKGGGTNHNQATLKVRKGFVGNHSETVLETVLSRAMSDAAFAEQLFADPEKALVDYELTADELAQIKGMSSVEFSALEADARKSLSIFSISSAPRANNEDK